MTRIPVLPTLITLGNAACGFASITYAMRAMALINTPNMQMQFNQNMQLAGWLIFCAMVFDALDGKVARLARQTSDFGTQLDSLCDVISFGVAPAIMVMVMASQQQHFPRFAWAASALYMACTALRLARFNVETDHSEEAHWYFKGLPSPAAAAFIAGLTINIFEIYEVRGSHGAALAEPEMALLAQKVAPVMAWLLWVVPFVAIALGLLMISRIRYVHVMNKMLRGQEPLDYLVKLMVVAILTVLTRPFSLALLVAAYACSGLVFWMKDLVFPRAADAGKPGPTPRP